MTKTPFFQGERAIWLREYLPTIALAIVLATSLGGNVLLAWRAQAMSRELVRVTALLPKGGVQMGATFPTVPVKTVAGTAQTISFDGEKTILYVVSQKCSWCRANEANIRAVASANMNRFRFVAVVLEPDGLSAYAKRVGLPFDVVSLSADEAFRDRVGFTATPQTIVLGRGGTVEKVWMGAWYGKRGKEIGTFFQSELPGLEASKESGRAGQ